MLKNSIQWLLVISTLTLGMQVIADTDDEQAIAERLKPVGTVCVQGDPCASESSSASADTSATEEVAAKKPEDIYASNCSACHASGAAGAPKLGDVAAWSARIAQGKETLYTHALGGFNSMPARGLCMNCSDDEIKATVDYIVGQSQ